MRDDFSISQLAIPAVSVLISFLAYSSQYFFLRFEDAPLRRDEVWKINIFALCIWICYFRACYVDPGRLPSDQNSANPDKQEKEPATGRQRWCRRFGMSYLETLLWSRASIVWGNRNLPSYMGPSIVQLGHLFILFVVNSLTVFALLILLVRSLYSLIFNMTTIESWEIERHDTLVRRARVLGGHLDGPGGIKVRIKKHEFPYDIGIWTNIKEGMGGSANILSWFWPLAATPDRRTGWEFETNGFEDPGSSWPPPDPDRIPWPVSRPDPNDFPLQSYSSARDTLEAFRQRQAEDIDRRRPYSEVQRRKRFHDRFEKEAYESDEDRGPGPVYGDDSDEGEESWRNAEGERLRDFGVDEDVEFYDEDDVPLAVLMQRRKQR
ncbi:Palmitoyltransferase pfa4 [Penicillium longicatenatum]|uniref:Palmitoyltransferase pfa4 n=1 Tax=Penicillium longicatenatum TaxID=1561947 RepID=UPI002549079C|nr:Palmitoyltransferase pfa4 [Penicillium longicatenatum]KAJ5630351.1 Palmitoyltransferase pfa4 [Penicillium longicatenatum]